MNAYSGLSAYSPQKQRFEASDWDSGSSSAARLASNPALAGTSTAPAAAWSTPRERARGPAPDSGSGAHARPVCCPGLLGDSMALYR